jgi:hypothetical protein
VELSRWSLRFKSREDEAAYPAFALETFRLVGRKLEAAA